MKAFFLLMSFVITSTSFATDQELIDLIKLTRTVYSGVMNVDYENSGDVLIEQTMNNQKVSLNVTLSNLDSSAYTLLNNDPQGSKTKAPFVPYAQLGKLIIEVNNTYPTSTCDGSDVIGTETSCAGKKCDIVQRLISACNATNCWNGEDDSAIDKPLQTNEIKLMKLNTNVDISDCIPNSVAGQKTRLTFRALNIDPQLTIRPGGTINYNVVLHNDTVGARSRK